MLARNYMYVRLRVHAVQWTLLLRLEVDDISPSLAVIQTWRVRPLISSYQVCSCSNFGLTIPSNELTSGHSNIYIYEVYIIYMYAQHVCLLNRERCLATTTGLGLLPPPPYGRPGWYRALSLIHI